VRRLFVIAFVAAATSVAGGALVRELRDGAATAIASPSPKLPTAVRFQWPAGTEVRYSVEWRTDSAARYGEQPFEGGVDIACDLVLRSYGEQGEVTLLGARLEGLRRHGVSALGQEFLPDAAAAEKALTGTEAFAEVDARGRLRAMRFPKAAPPLFMQIVQGVLTETQVTLPEKSQASWTALESGNLARAEQRYDVDAKDPSTLHRAAIRLDAMTAADKALLAGTVPSYEGTATIILDRAGHVVSVRSESSARAKRGEGEGAGFEGSTAFTLARTGEGRFTLPKALPAFDDATYDTRLPGQIVSSLSAADMDRSLSHDVTLANVEGIMASYAHGIRLERTWIARATAFLRLHPEHVTVVADKFATTNDDGKELVFDLLSGTGSREAQAAMRALIETKEARADRDTYARILQRFSFVRAPDRGTVDLLARLYQSAVAEKDPFAVHATVFAFGSAIGAFYVTGDRSTALAAHARLASDLRAAASPEDRTALLAALGNAGIPEGFADIVAFAGDPSESVRAQVATSLRKHDTAESREVLFRLVGDAEPPVTTRALRSLAQLKLAPADVARVADVVEAGKPSLATDALLVTFATDHKSAHDAAARILRAVAARSGEKPELRDRATEALASMEEAG